MKRPVDELVQLILTTTVALVLLTGVATIATLVLTGSTIDTTGAVVIIAELVAAILGYIIGTLGRGRDPVSPDMTSDSR